MTWYEYMRILAKNIWGDVFTDAELEGFITEVEAVIHEWDESAIAARSGVLAEAMAAPQEEE